MEKIEVTSKVVWKIADAIFKKQVGKGLKEAPVWLRNDWINSATEMLNDFNQVVEILTDIEGCCHYCHRAPSVAGQIGDDGLCEFCRMNGRSVEQSV